MTEAQSEKPAKAAKVKVQRARMLLNVHDRAVVKFQAGRHYPVNFETQTQVRQGAAELIEVEMDPADHEADVAACGPCDGRTEHMAAPRTIPGRA